MQRILLGVITILLACPGLALSQPSLDDMAMATLSEKMDGLGDEMNSLGKVMEQYGTEMEKYGKELEQHAGHAPKVEQSMEELGEKMNRLGTEMGKLGEQMSQYGEKMGVLQQQMTDWFFHALQQDGLLASLHGKTRILFDEKGLQVDGRTASAGQFNQYKAGLEKYWGRALKPDFLFFFKGTIREKDGHIETNGTMNTDF